MDFDDNDGLEEELEMDFGTNNMGSIEEELGTAPAAPVSPKAKQSNTRGDDRRLKEEIEKLRKENGELAEKLNLNNEVALKVHQTAQKKIEKLNDSLDEIDYSLGNFNKFQQRVKTFRVWSPFLYITISFILGLIFSFVCTYELYSYKTEMNTQKLNEYGQVGEIITNAGFSVNSTDNNIQVYIKGNSETAMFEAENGFLVIQKNK